MNTQLPSIVFLIGSPDISGGTYVIFEHAVRLMQRGYSITMITEEKIDPERLFWHFQARELTWKTFIEIATDKFDICFATWWRTVYEMHRVEARHYAYFNQSVESRFYPESEIAVRHLAEATYMLPLSIITEAGWIQSYIHDHYALDAQLVRNGIRKDLYTTEGSSYAVRESGKLRVLVEGPLSVPFKNVQRTIELCQQEDVEIWLLTSSEVVHVEGVDRVFSRVPITDVASIYCSCDVLVKLSYVEGMFGPPLEMFHCGGTAIVYDVTGYDEYIVHDHNALVAKRDDENQVLEYIRLLKNNSHVLDRLKQGALSTAHAWPDWDAASEQFEKAIQNIVLSDSVSSSTLKIRSDFYFQSYVVLENALKGKFFSTPDGQNMTLILASLEEYPLLKKVFFILLDLAWRIFRLTKRVIHGIQRM